MASKYVRETYAVLTADGDAAGTIEVNDNVGFYPGALAWIWGDTAAKRRVRVIRLVGASTIILAFHGTAATGETSGVAPSYTGSDMSAYTTTDNAKINMEGQTVRVGADGAKLTQWPG